MDEEARRIVGEMTDEEVLWCLDGDWPFWAGLGHLTRGGYHRSPFPAARVERLGFPGFRFADGPRGVVVDQATCFPVSMARGATWDPDLEERIGDAIGRELRAVGADLYGGVCVNVLRHPAWGRAQETYGEDPFHVGEMGAALTRGVQRHAMACVKHLACNSMEEARFQVDITVDDEALDDVYLPHFRRVVEEGVACVMSAYNAVNGEWAGESHHLLTEVLRERWGFAGFVISDWIFGLRDPARSLRAGLDVEMPYRMRRAEGLRAALDAGEVTWAEARRAVERVVATRLRFADVLDRPAPPRSVLACAEHRALAREAAHRSVVLLRNAPVDGRPLLPLAADELGAVVVVGDLADAVNLGDGGSSDVWAPEAVTVFAGLRAALPECGVRVVGSDPEEAVDAISGADVVIAVVGCTRLDEGEYIGATGDLAHLFPGPDDPELVAAFEAEVAPAEAIEPPDHVRARADGAAGGGQGGFATGGDRASLRLRPEDVVLVKALAAAHPRVVVVVMGGSAVVMSEWDGWVPAVVQAWYPGMEGGHGLADVLLGTVDASGRLPFSVPTDEAHLPPFDATATAFTYDRWHGWWHLEREGHRPAYPFGFGLSYTTFALRAATVEATAEQVRVTATVRNTGARDGSDVVGLYARAPGDRPRLVAFARVEVAAGAEVPVVLTAPAGPWWTGDPAILRVARHATDPGRTPTPT
ncbi:MAG TPA: glycoside hydrolase family 3 C-terminal domain-containing protein [Iamia sp.]|nr:glycoside hydrolase family 3 C-terminal domain-containing protein [Iamia sp.]